MELLACLLGSSSESDGYAKKSRLKFPDGVWADRPEAGKSDIIINDCGVCEHGVGSEPLEEHDKWMWWQADAWMETSPDIGQLMKTILFEFLPLVISLPVCLLLEGRSSAINRHLLPVKGMRKAVVFQCIVNASPWIVLIIWLATQPDDVSWVQAWFPMVLLLWRCVCIGLKYAYLAPSDMQSVKGTTQWSRTDRNGRILGLNKFFNLVGSLEFDQCEDLLKSVAFLGLQKEFKDSYFVVEKGESPFWKHAKAQLEDMSKHPEKHRISKYGDVFAHLGLDNFAAVEKRLEEEGQLPVSLVAYYFLSKYFKPTPVKIFGATLIVSILGAFVHPLVLHASGRASFGSTAASKVILGFRVFALFCLQFQPLIFLLFPPLSGFKRACLSYGILSSVGHGEARSLQLCSGSRDPPLQIQSMADLRAFWILGRVLGPTLDIGISYRYNCAYIAASVCFMIAATVSVAVTPADGNFEPGVLVEICIYFVFGAASVVTAALLCTRVNGLTPAFVSMIRRTALLHPELGGVAKDIAADFMLEHDTINPMQVMYMPAKPALISFFFSGLTVLAAMFISSLPYDICIPIFLSSKC